MNDIQILIGLIVVAVVFTWVSVKVIKEKTNNKADAKFRETVLSKLLELYGETTIDDDGLTTRALPADIQKAVSAFLNR